MTSREEILWSVRQAIGRRTPLVAVPERAAAPHHTDLVALFVERLTDYRAEVHRCAPDDLAGVIADLVGSARFVAPEDLDVELPNGLPDQHLPASDLDALDGVVTAASVAIAETGTIVLDHGVGQGRRAVTLVPDRHVCIVRTTQIVAGVAEAVSQLDPSRAQTWISGPSATSDIELERVEGVHGPRRLQVVIVG